MNLPIFLSAQRSSAHRISGSNAAISMLPSPTAARHKTAMFYTPDEKGWIEPKAREIARETAWPLPIARAEAQAEFRRMRD